MRGQATVVLGAVLFSLGVGCGDNRRALADGGGADAASCPAETRWTQEEFETLGFRTDNGVGGVAAAADDGYVYWTQGLVCPLEGTGCVSAPTLLRLALSGGNTQELIESDNDVPWGLALTGSRVFLRVRAPDQINSRVIMVSKGGSYPPEEVADMVSDSGPAADPSAAYFVQGGRLMRVDASKPTLGSPAPIASFDSVVSQLRARDGFLYWIGHDTDQEADIWRVPTSGGVPVQVVHLPTPKGAFGPVALSGDAAFVALPDQTRGQFSIVRVPLNGEDPVALTEPQPGSVSEIAADQDDVYWTSSHRTGLWRVPVAGGCVENRPDDVDASFVVTPRGVVLVGPEVELIPN